MNSKCDPETWLVDIMSHVCDVHQGVQPIMSSESYCSTMGRETQEQSGLLSAVPSHLLVPLPHLRRPTKSAKFELSAKGARETAV